MFVLLYTDHLTDYLLFGILRTCSLSRICISGGLIYGNFGISKEELLERLRWGTIFLLFFIILTLYLMKYYTNLILRNSSNYSPGFFTNFNLLNY